MDYLPAHINRQQLDIAVVAECDANNFRFHSPCYSEPLLFIPQELGVETTPVSSIRISDITATPVILTSGGCGLNDTIQQVFDNENVFLTR